MNVKKIMPFLLCSIMGPACAMTGWKSKTIFITNVEKVTKIIIQIDPNYDKNLNLFRAARKVATEKTSFFQNLLGNKFKELERLINDEDADVNYNDANWTMLHAVVAFENFELIKFFIDKGAYVDVKAGHNGLTVLECVEKEVDGFKKDPKILEYLMKNGKRKFTEK